MTLQNNRTKRITKLVVIYIVLIFVAFTGYKQIKLRTTKTKVENYLIKEEGIHKSDIKNIEKRYNYKAVGDAKYTIGVRVKGEEGAFYYYYDHDKNKAILSGYNPGDGAIYSTPKEFLKNNK